MQQHTSEEIIGSNLARYRKSAGMTQSALAGEIGTSIAFVSRVEKGEKMMKVQPGRAGERGRAGGGTGGYSPAAVGAARRVSECAQENYPALPARV